MNEIKSLIELIPTIVEYFVPGYVFITLWLFFTSKSVKNENFHLVACLIVSIAIRMIDRWIYHEFPYFSSLPLDHTKKGVILIATAAIFALIASKITTSRFFCSLCSWCSQKSIHDSIFREIINYKGCSLMIRCNDGTWISGILNSHEEKDENSWFALSEYTIEFRADETGFRERYKATDFEGKSLIVVKASDISSIQVFNSCNRCVHKSNNEVKKNKY